MFGKEKIIKKGLGKNIETERLKRSIFVDKLLQTYNLPDSETDKVWQIFEYIDKLETWQLLNELKAIMYKKTGKG